MDLIKINTKESSRSTVKQKEVDENKVAIKSVIQ